MRRRRFGAGRILHELKEKGVSDAAIEGARLHLKGSELQAAREVRRKKFGALPRTPAERAKQARFLAGRGFSAETVHAALRGGEDG
jgi:regulatory protein